MTDEPKSIPDEPPPIPDEAPPVLRAWPRVYVFVLVYLVGVIAAFYFLTRRLAP
jgi:hypothetical protein